MNVNVAFNVEADDQNSAWEKVNRHVAGLRCEQVCEPTAMPEIKEDEVDFLIK